MKISESWVDGFEAKEEYDVLRQWLFLETTSEEAQIINPKIYKTEDISQTFPNHIAKHY